MHILSAHNRSEFLATPQLVRFDFASGRNGFEPTLLVKADVVVLKYLTRGVRLQLMIAQTYGDRLIYSLIVHDDPTSPGIIWSVLEREEERQALLGLAEGKPLQVFLFNELAINVAWAEMEVAVAGNRLGSLSAYAGLGKFDHSGVVARVDDIYTALRDGKVADPTMLLIDLPAVPEWHQVRNSLITSRSGVSEMNLFDLDEGRQQEKLVIWLADNLHPDVIIDQPQIMKSGRFRELTDILLGYSGGTFIFESKALKLFNRPELPDRTKLSKNVLASIKKGLKQLKGAARQIRDGATIYDLDGREQEVERTQPIHAIILVPDLRLLPPKFGFDMMVEFVKATRGYLHILDPSELLRIVQIVEGLVRRSESQTITPMMALDSRFIERAETCVEAQSLNVEIITRFEAAF
ncbi:hypothetical protein ACU5AX_20480 [Sphingomonas sp. XXL09]|uniref:hypothetical protein n=1 Tax=Sphingomonas sp. XXL09 TaxID=3457787 RepID=UPI00406BB732